MGLNKVKGNMYDFVTHTWNAVKGQCYHDCSYCYMKRWGAQREVRLDESEFRTKLDAGKFIFVGSSCDLFANDIPAEWIEKTLDHCWNYKTKYLFQSKNPERIKNFEMPPDSLVCTTIETNRHYAEIMRNAPAPTIRAETFRQLPYPRYITIEPVLQFDFDELVNLCRICDPVQVNIGADSGGNGLPEPKALEIEKLIKELSVFTKVEKKKNLSRMYISG